MARTNNNNMRIVFFPIQCSMNYNQMNDLISLISISFNITIIHLSGVGCVLLGFRIHGLFLPKSILKEVPILLLVQTPMIHLTILYTLCLHSFSHHRELPSLLLTLYRSHLFFLRFTSFRLVVNVNVYVDVLLLLDILCVDSPVQTFIATFFLPLTWNISSTN